MTKKAKDRGNATQPELDLCASNPLEDQTIECFLHFGAAVQVKENYAINNFPIGFRAVIDNSIYHEKDEAREVMVRNGIEYDVVHCRVLCTEQSKSEVRCVLKSYRNRYANWQPIILKGTK